MPEMIRLFVAVELPESVRVVLSKLADELPADGIKKVEPENLHVTLKFLGEVDVKKLDVLEQALRTVQVIPFSLSLKGVGVFPNENYIRVVWVGCESSELAQLAQKINEALAPLFPKEKFSPHITIARVKRKIDIKNFLQTHANQEFGSLEVRGFALKQSELSNEGPKYASVAVFSC